MRKLRLAILDLYNGEPNQGMGAIKEIVSRYEHQLEWQVFDIRGKEEIPDMSFDFYISSGGPGSPLDGDGIWDARFFDWLDKVCLWNNKSLGLKKHVFFICHSFQMACHHFGIGEVTERKSRSFGTFPVHPTKDGLIEPFFKGLANPFFVADFRFWQVVHPNVKKIKALGAKLLALEKFRPQVPLDRAIMAVRFSDEIFGTQFHPEAFPEGMLKVFQQEEKKQDMIQHHSEDKYHNMMEDLKNPDKILRTYQTILPSFLENAIRSRRNVRASI